MTPLPRTPTRPRLPKTLERADATEVSDESTYRHLHLANLSLPEHAQLAEHLALVEFDGCRLSGACFNGAQLERAMFADCVVEDCDLANLYATASSLVRTELRGSRMTGMTWADGGLREVLVTGCRANLAAFRFTSVKHARFVDCDLSQADFTGADLRGTHFVDCVLTGAQFAQAQLSGARFQRCQLDQVRTVSGLRGAIIDADDLPVLAYALAVDAGIVIAGDTESDDVQPH